MEYTIVTSSQTGNANILAEKIKETLSSHDCIYFGPLSDTAKQTDIIFVGFWTDQGSADMECKHFLENLHNKKIFLFGTCGFGMDNNYFDKIINSTLPSIDSSNEVIGAFVCQGKMRQRVLDRYESMKASNTNIPNIDMLIENFHKALSHPDTQDLNNLKVKIENLNF